MRHTIQEIKRCGCCICGETEPCCLDFHHLRDKEFELAKAPDVSKERLYKELEKCIVLCANCHRKLHAGIISLPNGVAGLQDSVRNV